eukprot:CAMPEP_0178955374 /NCGR_PEP_ID=MMETSP0789-20121207/9564_1 /TAXON_ID=3005 /ORGANISM="Rhizosolenia setigera, Strain CCMP 1694" /LENGTH=290 /DNA_ID=CAMNT_0020636987 /DNA_START=169 /DNA_END=1041 /DNA_ORIENTATION=+
MNLSFNSFSRYLSTFCLLLSSASNVHAQNQHGIIVGGTEVEKGRYEYMVALTTQNGFQYCGASLISPGYALSAAHCSGNNPQVLIGRHDLSDSSEDFETIQVEYEVVHPGYNSWTLENDVMVLKLASNSTYSPVKYDDGSADTSSGVDVVVMGWGTTTSGGQSSDLLLEVELDAISNAECENEYGAGEITDDMLCASRAGKDSCQGDSGGPLILKGTDSASDVQIGIVSWGYGCADPDYSGVYSRVSSNTEFIECVVNGGSEACGDVKACDCTRSKLLKNLKSLMLRGKV